MPNEKTKKCGSCKKMKKVSAFNRDKTTASGRASWCRACRKTKEKDYYPSRKAIYKDRALRRRYGISYDQYIQMIHDQGGKCAICGRLAEDSCDTRIKNLAVDHDHVTGLVRGLVCQRCSLVLGYAGDDTRILQSAIEYLTKRGA